MLPVVALLLAAAAGFLKWQDWWIRSSGAAAIESVSAAKESTVAFLSYQPDSVDKDLGAARDRLTGKFKDSYTQLVHDVLIPGAKKDHISAIATVPASASVSATPNHAVALVFVNQTVTVGNDAPTDTAPTVRVISDKSGNRCGESPPSTLFRSNPFAAQVDTCPQPHRAVCGGPPKCGAGRRWAAGEGVVGLTDVNVVGPLTGRAGHGRHRFLIA